MRSHFCLMAQLQELEPFPLLARLCPFGSQVCVTNLLGRRPASASPRCQVPGQPGQDRLHPPLEALTSQLRPAGKVEQFPRRVGDKALTFRPILSAYYGQGTVLSPFNT